MERLYKENNYPNEKNFYQILKDNGIISTHAEVKAFLKSRTTHQLHRPVKRNRKLEKYIVAQAPLDTYQVDLLDYQKYSRQNEGNRYILLAVDIFTRKAFAEPLTSKTPQETARKMNAILEHGTPNVIFSDNGNEWKGAYAELLKERNINQIFNELGDHQSLGIIDRLSRTIKEVIARHFTETEEVNWTRALTSIINSYNNSPHSALENIKPAQATQRENKLKIGTINYLKQEHNNEIDKKQSLRVGDTVRIQKQKGTFEKGYSITYSPEVHRVISMTVTHAELDDGTKHKKNKLMIIPANSNAVSTDIQETANRSQQQLKKLMKEGVSSSNILAGPRRGKIQNVAFPGGKGSPLMYRRDVKF
jgi:hypothetical protein